MSHYPDSFTVTFKQHWHTRIQERARSTKRELEGRGQQRPTKDVVHLGGSRGGSYWQTRMASECGPMCPVGYGMNQGQGQGCNKVSTLHRCQNHYCGYYSRDTRFCSGIMGPISCSSTKIDNLGWFSVDFVALGTSYRCGSSTAVQIWRSCPLWEPSPRHPILVYTKEFAVFCVYTCLIVFLCYLCTFCVPSVFWYRRLGLLTCKNRHPYNLYCVGGDVKPCSVNQSTSNSASCTAVTSARNTTWNHLLARMLNVADCSKLFLFHFSFILVIILNCTLHSS